MRFNRFQNLAVLLLVLIVAGHVWPIEVDTSDRLVSSLWSWLHFWAMAAAVLLLCWLVRSFTQRSLRWAVVAGGVMVPLMEATQRWTGRTATLSDILMGWAGVMAGAAVVVMTTHNKPRLRMAAFSVLALLTLATGSPTAGIALDRRMAARAFPLLATFRTPMEVSRWSDRGCRIKRSRAYAQYGSHALSIFLQDPVAYPGVFMEDLPQRDWSNANALMMEMYLEGEDHLSGWIRVDDKPAPVYADRYEHIIRLVPGRNTVRVELGDTFTTPHGRPLRKDRIRRFGLFFDRHAAGRTVHLDAVYLSPDSRLDPVSAFF